MGLRNWANRKMAERKYAAEAALLEGAYLSLSKPGEWPLNTTLVTYFSDTTKLIDAEAVIGAPDEAEYQSVPPSGASHAVAFWHNSDLTTVFVIRRSDEVKFCRIEFATDDYAHYHFNVEGPVVDNMFGNFASIFKENQC